jgi:hypothetical protein
MLPFSVVFEIKTTNVKYICLNFEGHVLPVGHLFFQGAFFRSWKTSFTVPISPFGVFFCCLFCYNRVHMFFLLALPYSIPSLQGKSHSPKKDFLVPPFLLLEMMFAIKLLETLFVILYYRQRLDSARH